MSPKQLLATRKLLRWKMRLLCSFLLWLSLSNGLGANCPGRCSCDAPQFVQCYRLLEVPSGIPPTTRRLYISHSRIQHLQVTASISPEMATVLFLEQGGCGVECGDFKIGIILTKRANSQVKPFYYASMLLGISF